MNDPIRASAPIAVMAIYTTAALFVNYADLIDPKYYIWSISGTSNWDQIIYNSRSWSTDISFIVLSTLIAQVEFDDTNNFIIFIILQMLAIALVIKKAQKFSHATLISLALLLNISLFTGIFNTWRQSFTEILILYGLIHAVRTQNAEPVKYNTQMILIAILALSFHAKTGLIYLVYCVFNMKILSSKLKWTALLLVAPILLYSGFFDWLASNDFVNDSLQAYSGQFQQVLLFKFITGLALFVGAIFTIRSTSQYLPIVYFLLFVLIVSLSLSLILPSASDRIMRLFWSAFPLIFIGNVTKKNCHWVTLVLLAFILINMIFISQSTVFSAVLSSVLSKL